MEKMDEYGRPKPGANKPGITAQFPIYSFKQALGWTEKYFKLATPAEVAEKFLELRKGYLAALVNQMKRALYGVGDGTTSKYTFVDRLTNGASLICWPLANGGIATADLPDAPDGTTFLNTHDHMNGDATVTALDVQATIDHVTEHGNTKGLKLIYNKADAAAIEALTGFTALSEAVFNYNGTQSTIVKLATQDLSNQLKGYWKGAIECWVKPWAVDGYLVCVATGEPEKALGYRQRPQSELQGWRIVSMFEDHPLIAEYAEAEFGFAAFNRTMAAIDYMDNDTWANPTITDN
jgi:hypothetical protein